jgi:hypothetical protein
MPPGDRKNRWENLRHNVIRFQGSYRSVHQQIDLYFCIPQEQAVAEMPQVPHEVSEMKTFAQQ